MVLLVLGIPKPQVIRLLINHGMLGAVKLDLVPLVQSFTDTESEAQAHTAS